MSLTWPLQSYRKYLLSLPSFPSPALSKRRRLEEVDLGSPLESTCPGGAHQPSALSSCLIWALLGRLREAGQVLPFCMAPGTVNIERSVCFFWPPPVGNSIIIATHNKEEGAAGEFLYWNSECFHCSPQGTKREEWAFSREQYVSKKTERCQEGGCPGA